jgi:uncharacterized repeat protein (TIGR01451 family)
MQSLLVLAETSLSLTPIALNLQCRLLSLLNAVGPTPVDCVGTWGPLSNCSATTCGSTGTQTQTFNVTPAANGGAACPADRTTPCTAPCPTGADVAVAVSGPASVVPGGAGLMVFTSVVSNAGPSIAQSVSLVDTLPAQLVLAGPVTSTLGACQVGGNTVQCAIGDLMPGQTAAVTLAFIVPADVAPGVLTNVACVTTASLDQNANNNCESTFVNIIGVADVAVAVSGPASVVPGGAVFTSVVTNSGPSVARSVSLVDTLPAQLILAGSVTSSLGACQVGGDTVQCAIGDLMPGQTAAVTFAWIVPANIAPGLLTNVACVTTASLAPLRPTTAIHS